MGNCTRARRDKRSSSTLIPNTKVMHMSGAENRTYPLSSAQEKEDKRRLAALSAKIAKKSDAKHEGAQQ